MRRSILILVCLFTLLYRTAYAHPPQDISITYDAKTRTLTAVITHNTSNPLNHYIKKIDIGLNGLEIIEHKISKQDNFESQSVSYLIPDAKAGDKISVEAYCSISGKTIREISVTE